LKGEGKEMEGKGSFACSAPDHFFKTCE
jgi:hypothetical protein